MKKLLLIFLAPLLYTLAVVAQPATPFAEKNIVQGTAGKTTSTESRLVGLCHLSREGNGMKPEDSFYYAYSGNNGWDNVLGDWKFDSCMHVMYPGTSVMEYTHRLHNTFDVQKRTVGQLYESYSLGVFYETNNTVYTYNANGSLAMSEESDKYPKNMWSPYIKIINSYNKHGDLVERISQYANHVDTLRNTTREVRTYDAHYLQSTQSYYNWDTVANQWNEYFRNTFAYAGNKPVMKMQEQYWGKWSPYMLSNYTYDSNDRLTEEEVKLWTGSWQMYRKYIYTYDAAGNQTSVLTKAESSGKYIDYEKTTTSYNSFGQPLISKHQEFNGSGLQIGDEYHYHYEQFTNGITGILAEKAALQIYPNPAATTINLKLDWNETQPATILLFDMTGKVAGQWTTPSTTLDISNIPPGTYMLKVMGTKEVLNRQVNIVR